MVLSSRRDWPPTAAWLDGSTRCGRAPTARQPDGQPGSLLAGQHSAAAHRQPVPVNGGPPNYAADRNAIPLYAFPGQRITTHFIQAMPVRVSALRGLGAYGGVFALEESFIDELRMPAANDPVAYRLRHDRARARARIELAAERFGWSGFQRTPGRGRGIAFARYKNLGAYTAVAVGSGRSRQGQCACCARSPATTPVRSSTATVSPTRSRAASSSRPAGP
jgi:hypothetical protein